MSAKSSARKTVGFVLLLIAMVLLLGLGIVYHFTARSIISDPETLSGLPIKSEVETMLLFLNDWTYLELASTAMPDEPRWPVVWSFDQPWSPSGDLAVAADTVNSIFSRYGAALQVSDDEFVQRPVAIDLSVKGYPYLLYFQALGPRETVAFRGNILPAERYYNTVLPESYQSFKRGHPTNFQFNRWLEMGVVEVTFVPQDTTIAPILLEPFGGGDYNRYREHPKLATAVVDYDGFAGPAGNFRISVVTMGTSYIDTIYNVIAVIMLVLWLIALVAMIMMMSRLRRQAR